MRTKAMEVETFIVSFSVFCLALENIHLILFKRKESEKKFRNGKK